MQDIHSLDDGEGRSSKYDQKRLRLPNLANNHNISNTIEISTNQSSSIRKEKRSQSTMRGGGNNYSRVTLHTNVNSVANGSIGYRKDSSLATIQPNMDKI